MADTKATWTVTSTGVCSTTMVSKMIRTWRQIRTRTPEGLLRALERRFQKAKGLQKEWLKAWVLTLYVYSMHMCIHSIQYTVYTYMQLQYAYILLNVFDGSAQMAGMAGRGSAHWRQAFLLGVSSQSYAANAGNTFRQVATDLANESRPRPNAYNIYSESQDVIISVMIISSLFLFVSFYNDLSYKIESMNQRRKK